MIGIDVFPSDQFRIFFVWWWTYATKAVEKCFPACPRWAEQLQVESRPKPLVRQAGQICYLLGWSFFEFVKHFDHDRKDQSNVITIVFSAWLKLEFKMKIWRLSLKWMEISFSVNNGGGGGGGGGGLRLVIFLWAGCVFAFTRFSSLLGNVQLLQACVSKI